MAILARSDRAAVAELLDGAEPEHAVLKAPEIGTVMIEGRAGGAGARFNLGEATMTRCVIRLPSGTMGFAYALKRDREHARLSAIADALLQEAAPGSAIHTKVDELARLQATLRRLASAKAARTRVEFFTMVRGD